MAKLLALSYLPSGSVMLAAVALYRIVLSCTMLCYAVVFSKVLRIALLCRSLLCWAEFFCAT